MSIPSLIITRSDDVGLYGVVGGRRGVAAGDGPLVEDTERAIGIVSTRTEDKPALLAHGVVVRVCWPPAIVLGGKLASLGCEGQQTNVVLVVNAFMQSYDSRGKEVFTATLCHLSIACLERHFALPSFQHQRHKVEVDRTALGVESVVARVHAGLDVGHQIRTMPVGRDFSSVAWHPPTRAVTEVNRFHGARAICTNVVFSVAVVEATHVVVVATPKHCVDRLSLLAQRHAAGVVVAVTHAWIEPSAVDSITRNHDGVP